MTARTPLTPAALAARLPALWAASETPAGAGESGDAIFARHQAADRACFALERQALAAPPRTLADAAALVMLATSHVGTALTLVDPDALLRDACRGLAAALPVIARAGGLDLATIAGDRYGAATAPRAGG